MSLHNAPSAFATQAARPVHGAPSSHALASTCGSEARSLKKRILLVEDSRTQAHQLRCLLEAEGYLVEVATDGMRGFELCGQSKFDLVISDIVMPGLSGYDLCKQIKEDRVRQNIPVILLTSLAEPLEIIRGLECGADNFLNKPCKLEYLLSRIRAVLTNAEIQDRAKVKFGAEVFFLGKKLNINSNTEQILNLLISTFEDVVRTNSELRSREAELAEANKIVDQYARQLESRVLSTESQYQRIVQTMPDGLWLTDADGRITYVNGRMAEMLGYAEAEILGKKAAEFVEEYGPALSADDTADGKPDHFRRHDFKLRRKDGTDLWTIVSQSPVFDSERRVTGSLAIITDITERRSLEEQYRQSQKMEIVGQLAGGVAHDFNNMLAVILGFSDILESSDHLKPNDRQMLSEIRKAGERAATLTRQLLAFSRKQLLEPKVLNLNVVLDSMAQMLQRLIREDTELVTNLSPTIGSVKVDPGQIDQVIMNLIVNARDAMPSGGRITIETADVELDESDVPAGSGAKPGRFVRLSVTDTGCGMDEATQAHIFEPFFTTKEPGKGTGLGLATVYGIVNQSGGHIAFTSKPGQGTSFKIYLPRIDGPADRARSDKTRAASVRGVETILVVEDEPAVRNLVSQALRSQGYCVLEAAHGEAALVICNRHDGPIHLVVTDVVMPQMSGTALTEKLRALRPDLKLLFMSGYTDDSTFRNAVSEVETNFIRKPFSATALALRVRNILDE